MNGYAIGRQNGWMSANDIRELENLDRIPAEDGGDLSVSYTHLDVYKRQEYKMWGNGVALPCVWFVLCGIVWYAQSGGDNAPI